MGINQIELEVELMEDVEIKMSKNDKEYAILKGQYWLWDKDNRVDINIFGKLLDTVRNLKSGTALVVNGKLRGEYLPQYSNSARPSIQADEITVISTTGDLEEDIDEDDDCPF